MGWIQSKSGRKVSFTAPATSMFEIEDIAHSLSMMCRFNGHGLRYYSVAEHSVHVSHEINPSLSLVGLLHDAAEAYIGDVPAPLKRHLPDYQKYETAMEAEIAKFFSISADEFRCDELKRADIQLLADEKAVLMVGEPEPWPIAAPPPKNPSRIKAWDQQRAKRKFLERFNELANAQSNSNLLT